MSHQNAPTQPRLLHLQFLMPTYKGPQKKRQKKRAAEREKKEEVKKEKKYI